MTLFPFYLLYIRFVSSCGQRGHGAVENVGCEEVETWDMGESVGGEVIGGWWGVGQDRRRGKSVSCVVVVVYSSGMIPVRCRVGY